MLVAEAEDGGAFAAEVERVEFLEHLFPVALELAVVPGGDAEDQAVEVEHLLKIVLAISKSSAPSSPRGKAKASSWVFRSAAAAAVWPSVLPKKMPIRGTSSRLSVYSRDFISLSSMSRAALLSPAILRRSIISVALASSSTCSSINHWRKTWLA